MNTSHTSRGVSKGTHATFWISALAVVAFAIWASFSTLDIVANTVGEVIPSSQIKIVQHLEGGIVREIKVEEGQKVDADQPLVILEPTVSGAETALAEAQAELAQIRSAFADDVQKSLEETRLRYRELTECVRKFEDSLERTVVRSPVQGIVKTLHVVTIGGVLGPGDKVAEVVPIDDRLIVEAKLKTQDIGYVAVGQQAVVRLASSDAVRFGKLAGVVAEVSPDTLIDDDGRPFYRVRIELPQDHFEKGGQRYALFPGMQVSASIMTGERTVMDYILDPLLYRMSNAFQER